MKGLSGKAREGIAYLIFGILTTVVNYAVYWAADRILGGRYLAANVIAWICAVTFAFVTNRRFVFRSGEKAPSGVILEALRFAGARVFSLGIEELGLWLLNSLAGWEEVSFGLCRVTVRGTDLSKLLMCAVVIVMNYFLSRFLVFRKRKED